MLNKITKAFLWLIVGLALARCGIDGEPIPPDADQAPPKTGVQVSGEAYVGGVVSSPARSGSGDKGAK